MYPRVVRTTLACTLALGVWLLAGPGTPAADEDEEAVAKDFQKLVDKVKSGKPITEAEAKEFQKKHDDLEEVMHMFKPPAKGKTDIEKRIMDLEEKGISKEQAAREKEELVRGARVARVIAQLLPAYAPPEAGKAKDWNRLAREMGKGAEGFEKAAQKGEPEGVKKAAGTLNGSCNECHKKFRDK
jgi:soluble cytochrome b562